MYARKPPATSHSPTFPSVSNAASTWLIAPENA